jgi:hypothetical protein
MKDSDKPALPDRPELEIIKRLISRNRPEDMGIMELVLIDAWLSEEMQSGAGQSKRLCDLKKLRSELENRLRSPADSSQ